jgi:hypothetical protein
MLSLMPAQPLTTHTAESLLTTAEDLEKSVAELRQVAERMKLLEIPAMEITHNDQRTKSVTFADNFASAARQALREARDRKISGSPDEPKPRVRRPSKSTDS